MQAQLRVQGLQEYLSNMMGPNGLLNEGEPLLTLLRRQSKLKPVSEKLEQLRQKVSLSNFTSDSSFYLKAVVIKTCSSACMLSSAVIQRSTTKES